MKISKAYLQTVYTEDELRKILEHIFHDKPLSDTSKRQYSIKIPQWISYISPPHTLHHLIYNPIQSMEYLKKTEKIKHSPANHHIYISSVVAFIKYVLIPQKNTVDSEKLFKEWKEVERANWKPIAEHYEENKPTELQKDKLMEFDEINKIRESLEPGSLERLLLSFYTLIEPIRADYYSTEIVNSEEDATTDNYIILKPLSAKLIVKDFKTKQKYDKIENVLSSELMEELKISLKKYPRKYVFVMDDKISPFPSRKLYSNWACRILTRILKQPMTLTVLRHIYITEKIKQKTTPNELRDIAKKMGHSREIQRIYEWQNIKQ